jgi:hypothetical protein
MKWSFSRLRPLHIALVSVVYWLGLIAVKLGNAILATWWISRLPKGHGSMSATLQNLTLSVTMAQDGRTLWSGSTSLGALLAWVVGPPLLLALTWRWSRDVEVAGDTALDAAVGSPADRAARPLAPPPVEWPTDRRPTRR